VFHQLPTVISAAVCVLLDSLEQTARPLSIHARITHARMEDPAKLQVVLSHADAHKDTQDPYVKHLTHALPTHVKMVDPLLSTVTNATVCVPLDSLVNSVSQ
jgi:hypothetical protein